MIYLAFVVTILVIGAVLSVLAVMEDFNR